MYYKTKHKFLKLQIIAGLVFVMLSSASCGDENQSAVETNLPTVSETTIESVPPRENVFRRLWEDPPTLDPHRVTDTTSAAIAVEVFSGLVTLSLDLKLEPDLAERWNISQDGRTYTFFLRENAKFHDGRKVTAEDIQYSLERALDPKTLSLTADSYLDDIVGAKEKFKGEATHITGIKVLDSQTISITIDEPKAYFLAKLTYPTAFVVDRKNIERDGTSWLRNPNGTGPFKLREYKIGEQLILERNENYYRELARLDRVEFILSGGSSMAMYENNEIHITGIGLADLDRVTNPNEALNRELMIAPPSFDITYIGFNTDEPPFDDMNFRQALNHATNKELIAAQVLLDLVEPANAILPPAFPGYTGRIQGLTFDPELAKALLSTSKYAEETPRIIITTPGSGGSIGLDLEVILQMWSDILGIEVELQQVETATFLEDLSARNFQAFAGIGWQAEYPDPHDFLDILFHSESKLNHSGYANSAVDQWLEQARTAKWEDREQLYFTAEQQIINDAPWVPLWYSGERMALVKPYIKGFNLTPMIVPKLREVFIQR
ncbi:peptide ABC transporter substrate-binding protein [SAR202 cluster bacterium AD-802-E10_MRT_200m]|nr:peptide ABC transporter substrate-binding protein [SAR202 cluster bacterium AD-802-E10_MRT_200m]MQF82586.1 peptide ABC transporter substrate-binding protein [SAR202 cluster bacterium AD-802-E10_MRT_200m]